MEKIPTLFQRNDDGDRLVRDELVPGTEWVMAGEGIATKKFDGTCCFITDGRLYKRYELKHNGLPPTGFKPAQDPDPVTGDTPGWLPVTMGADDRWHREAFARHEDSDGKLLGNDTYELCGPKIQGNPEGFATHVLVQHGNTLLLNFPRTFAGIRQTLRTLNIEGVVWRHPDGRMAKIKQRDFGLKRQEARR